MKMSSWYPWELPNENFGEYFINAVVIEGSTGVSVRVAN